MTRFSTVATMATMAVLLAACAREEPGQAAPDTTARAGAPGDAGMQAMPGMPAMQGMAMQPMMQQMRTHMAMMDTAAPQTMRSMLPAHRQMAANMLSQFDRDMRQMNMAADAEWRALTDSVRADLIRMPDMSPNELKAFMPAHGARLMRLMQRHQAMMGRGG